MSGKKIPLFFSFSNRHIELAQGGSVTNGATPSSFLDVHRTRQPVLPSCDWIQGFRSKFTLHPYICPSSTTVIFNQDSWALNQGLDPTGKWSEPFGKVSKWWCHGVMRRRKMLLTLRKIIKNWKIMHFNYCMFLFAYFHRFGLVVAMSVRILSPSHAIF